MAQPPLTKPLPKNWPKEIPYLSTPLRSPALTPTQLTAIRTPPPPGTDTQPNTIPHSLPRGPNPAVEIRPITDPHHPARGQAGLFATRRLEPGSLILPYLGEIHPGAASTTTSTTDDDGYDYSASDYDLWLSRDADVAVDAARCGNEARFVNDYRGVPGADRANAEFREVWDPRWRYRVVGGEGNDRRPPVMAAQAGEWGMALFVLPIGRKTLAKWQQGGSGKKAPGGIEEGEEILVSYGKGFWEKRREESGEAP